MKKKLLAGLLSFTVLTAQMLPVIAADDADVVVSENAVVEDEEEAEVVEGEEFFDFAQHETSLQDVEIGEIELDEASSSYIYVGAPAKYTYTVTDNVEFNGKVYNSSTTIAYNSKISYRAKKIKADLDLGAAVSASGLYAMVNDLTTVSGTGITAKDVITVKFSAKKNKNANSGSYFTTKFSVKSKNAKALGIKGKSLKALKKAVKQLNKVAKAKENRVSFTITAIDANLLWDNYQLIGIGTYRGFFIGTFQGFSHFRARLLDTQPDTIDSKTLSKWSKVTKSDLKVTKIGKEGGYIYYTVTPQGKNFYGNPFVMRFSQTTGF